MIDLRPILLVTGVLLATLGCAMMIPALYDLTVGHEDWLIFSASATITLFVGVGLAFANRGRTESFSIKQAFLLTNVIWVSLTAFGALPFAWSQLDISYTDAFFESMSGITTTGATILTGLDKAPPGILLWRALLQWLGGLGIIVMAISLLPILQVGGMQLFRVEGFETEGKFMPRATQIAGSLSVLYLAITTICAVTYYIAGMSVFDAVVHSMTTIATGGFSSHDASIAYFSSPLIEVLAFIAYQPSQPEPLGPRLITIVFNVVSIMTGTGYATTAYDTWSAMAVVVFFILMFIGGCSGSTSCGMKIFRFQIIFEMIRCRLQAVIHPKGVFVERYNGAPIADTVTSAVMGFFFLFLLCFAIIATLLTFIGLDTVTALSAAASAVANVGPGLGQIVGPVGTYAGLPDSAKWILSFGMLLGRLEIFTVIVLFTPTYWRA